MPGNDQWAEGLPAMCRNVLAVVCQGLKLVWFLIYYTVLETTKSLLPQWFMKSVDGDIVLITGGGSGIGRLMAQKLASLGAIVVTLDVNDKGNKETVELIKGSGHQAFCYHCDVSKQEEIQRIGERVKVEVGSVSMLINNAGIVNGSPLLETPDSKIKLTMDINVLAHFWLVKLFLPDMIEKKKGHIVTVASIAGLAGSNKLTDYCASKFANVGFDEALRTEMYHLGHSNYINTTVICPYYINTGMFAGVRSKIFSILEPDYVRDECIKAILTNKEILMLPKVWGPILCTMKTILPTRAFTRWGQYLGFNSSMDQFTGRAK